MNYGNKSGKLKGITSFLLPTIGAITVIAFLAAIWFWEFYGREMLTYKDVIVLNENTKSGTIIEKGMISKIKMETNKLIDTPIEDESQVIGMAAKHFIPKNAQLTPNYLEDPAALTLENQYIFKIPNEWIQAVPNSLRRKDTAYIYEISSKLFEQGVTQETPDESTEETENTENTSIKTYVPGSTADDDLKAGNEICKTTVAYVKDSANREVVTLSDKDRYDGSSTIAEVDVILSAEEFRLLEQSIAKGNKLIIMYKENDKEG